MGGDEDVTTMVFAHRAFTTWHGMYYWCVLAAENSPALSFWSVAVVYLGSISQERPRVDWQLNDQLRRQKGAVGSASLCSLH